jgi:hypothetical protein
VVNLPHPTRYALHKLLVFGERTGTFAAKASKDLSQAAHILACLRRHRAREVREAWNDLLARGKGWASRGRVGLRALATAFPDLEIHNWLAHSPPNASGE